MSRKWFVLLGFSSFGFARGPGWCLLGSAALEPTEISHRELRVALGDDAACPMFIETLAGKGIGSWSR